jgi:hypothetical protein
MREVWRDVLVTHICVGAQLPISLDDQARRSTHRMLEKACRRRIMFQDDCLEVRSALDEVRGRASRVVYRHHTRPKIHTCVHTFT